MSWTAAVFALVALVIAGGIAWYEASRPSSRMVALVAALGALAVAGRLVLAPIPNVVATTDIALITGYALGAVPGFAVGALAAPVSNMWLGQGPWTPWQMAGWGLVGVGGAALALCGRRQLGRVGLATACAAAGLAYGALLDLSVMVSYGGEQSLDRYLALSVRGIPFNVAHAAGNFAFALAAGPALVRMIGRYRTRMVFDWRPAGVPLAALLVAAGLATALLGAEPARAAGPAAGRGYLQGAQNGDGGFGFEPGSRSSPQMTGWTMLGLEAAGRNPLDVGSTTPVDYLRSRAGRLRSPSDLELAILAVEGAGLDARHFAGTDLARKLARAQGGDGSFGGQVNLTAYGILALRAAGVSAGVARASAWLRGAQQADGGWGSSAGARSDPDSTGSAVQGLRAAGGGAGISGGVAYLRRTQKRGGGWGLYETGVTNSQSTSFAVMGLVAAGVDPSSVRTRGRSGIDFIAARQAGDGHYAYSSSSDQTPVWVTAQALLALEREALPIEPVPRGGGGATSPSPDVPVSQPSATPAGHEPGKVAGSAPAGASRGDQATRRPDGRSDAERSRAGARHGGEEGRRRRLDAAPASAAAPLVVDEGGRADPTPWIAGGFAALAAALLAGFLWYRRRLP